MRAAPESRSRVSLQLFGDGALFRISVPVNCKKKRCAWTDPLTGFGGAAEAAMFRSACSAFAANVVLFFCPTLFFRSACLGCRRSQSPGATLPHPEKLHLQPRENGRFPPFPSESHILAWPRSDNSEVWALLGLDLISASPLRSRDPVAALCVSQTQAFDLCPRGLLIQSQLQEAQCQVCIRGLCVQPDRAPLEAGGGAKDRPCIETAACFMLG